MFCLLSELVYSKNKQHSRKLLSAAFDVQPRIQEGVSFGSVMYSWTKEFCDSPRADKDKSCVVIPLNRAIRARSQAFIEACKLIIPKGNSEKQIKKQLKELSSNLERSVEEEEEGISDSVAQLSFDEIIVLLIPLI